VWCTAYRRLSRAIGIWTPTNTRHRQWRWWQR